jgi:hypothetical protein
MPSPFPRISIVLTHEQHHLLTRLASIQQKSQASYVRHLVDLATPSLRALLTPLEQAVAEQEAMDENLQMALEQGLQEAEEELEAQLEFGDALGVQQALEAQWEESWGVDDADAGERPQTAPASSTEAAGPPYCNTGVRDPEHGGAEIVRFERRHS